MVMLHFPDAADYVGKNKDFYQLQYEQGLYVEGMKGRQTEKLRRCMN